MQSRLNAELDALARLHGLFKVDTVGDAYIAVGNLPDAQADHAARVAQFSLAAVAAAEKVYVSVADPSLGTLAIRACVHSGAVIASVIGHIAPRYALFGDTINTAGKMCAAGEAGRVLVSAVSRVLLEAQAPALRLVARGSVPIKGISDMETFWLQTAEEAGGGGGGAAEEGPLDPPRLPIARARSPFQQSPPKPPTPASPAPPSPMSSLPRAAVDEGLDDDLVVAGPGPARPPAYPPPRPPPSPPQPQPTSDDDDALVVAGPKGNSSKALLPTTPEGARVPSPPEAGRGARGGGGGRGGRKR